VRRDGDETLHPTRFDDPTRDPAAAAAAMSAAAKIASFAAGLAVLFAAAVALGGAVDPQVEESPAEHGSGDTADAMEAHETTSSGSEPPGLATTAAGYRIVPAATEARRSPRARYEFTVLDPEGEPVTDYDVEHERRMHVIVVRRDFAGFQHVHPEMRPDGTWSARIDTRLPGTYRVFADFATAGRSLTLATDLSVPGGFVPEPLAKPAATASAGDGYEVTMSSTRPRPGATAAVEFEVTRNGRPVAVEPYLGAGGHLVVLRAGDLAFLHVHPQGRPDGGPIGFDVELPSAGAYRAFLQFRDRGAVRTAAFTEVVGGPGAGDGHDAAGGDDGH
jgi:hypothetical protein